MTVAKAYQKICEQNPDKTISICYYLYSLQGALLDLHWNKIPETLKKDLVKQVRKQSIYSGTTP